MSSVGWDAPRASTKELVEVVAACAAELAARPAPESAVACFEQAEALGRTADLMEAAIASRVAEADRAGEPQRWGFPSTTSWLRTRMGMRHSRAEDRTVLARQVGRLPQVAKRLAAEDLSYGYASVIAAAVRRLDDEECGNGEAILLQMVDAGCTVREVTAAGDRIKALIAERDGTEPEPEDGRRGERQWWTMHRGSGGQALSKGLFSAELAALIRARIEPLAAPAGPEDSRDHAQRMADALQMVLSEGDSRWDPIVVLETNQQPPRRPRPGRSGGATAPVGAHPAHSGAGAAAGEAPAEGGPDPGEPTHLSEAIETQVTPGESSRPAGEPGSLLPPGPSWPFDGTAFTARLADGTPIPVQRAREILINAGYSALVLGADGQPLYLGRTVRCATPHQRRVLLARYPTCVVRDCDIPGGFCQVDHVDGWVEWGPTDIDKLTLTCRFHNVYKYEHPDRVSVTLHGDGRYVYRILRPADPRTGRSPGRTTIDRPRERGP
jgi:hypothetical protein